MPADADTGRELSGNAKEEGASEIKPNLESGSKEEMTKVEKNTSTTPGEVNKELLQVKLLMSLLISIDHFLCSQSDVILLRNRLSGSLTETEQDMLG